MKDLKIIDYFCICKQKIIETKSDKENKINE
jgi:hypothetical protein